MADRLIVAPRPNDPDLSAPIEGLDENGRKVSVRVIAERPLTLFLNESEIVTLMTIGDHPDLLALGYLVNQNIIAPDHPIRKIDYDEELGIAIVRTDEKTSFEDKLKKKIKTSGCAQGTIFEDVIHAFENRALADDARLKTSWLGRLTRQINTIPSLYLAAGAIHGCVLCRKDAPLVYMEDVGRHNAVDKIAGWMARNGEPGADKIFYTTGRLTGEMIIKTVMMDIPILVSRSGFTAWGVELARKAGLTLIGRARGKRFMVLCGEERIVFDDDPRTLAKDSKDRANPPKPSSPKSGRKKT